MTKHSWLARLKELHKAKNSHHFAIGDCVNEGVATFGVDDCFEAVQQIAGSKSTRNLYRRCATVAALYPSALRYTTLTFHTYETLRHFPIEWLSTYLPTVKDSGRSCAQILHLAIEQFGSYPGPERRNKKYKKRYSVNLAATVYFAALAKAKAEKQQTQTWIEQVIENHLAAAQGARKDAVGDAEAARNETDVAEQRPKTSAPYTVVEVDLSDEQEATRKWAQRVGIGTARSGPQEFLDERDGLHRLTNRPSYQQRREEQLKKSAMPINPKSVRGIEISLHGSCKLGKTSCFRTLEDACEAAAIYEAAKKYPIEAFVCEKCGSYHIRCDEARYAEAFERAKAKAREIQAHVNA
jgi:hypothetical protein